MQNKFMNTVLRRFTPYVGTLLLGALLLFAYRAWAAPGTPPENNAAPLAGPAAQGATPNTLSYQGYLTNAAGQPINGTLSITFRIYNVPTGGAALWTETRSSGNAVPVSDGLFNVHLGSLAPIPASVWENSALYLSIQVGSDAEMSPRQVIDKLPWPSSGGSWTLPDGSVTTAKLADLAVTTGKIANGAINGAKIADGSIQWGDLASGIFPVYNASTTQDAWQLSGCGGDFNVDGNYYTIPGLSINVSGPGAFVIDLTGMGYNSSAACAVYSAIFIDGAAIRVAGGSILLSGCRNHSTAASSWQWCSLANSTFVTLGAGSHTIEARAFCDGSSAIAKIQAGWLRVIKLP